METEALQQHYAIQGYEVGSTSVNHFGVNIFRQADPLGCTSMKRAWSLCLYRIFQRRCGKESTGFTPNDYLLRLRISRAKELIAGTDDSLRVIA